MDGNLCDSPITKYHLEKIFQEYFHSSATIQNVEAEIISKGIGFLSDVMRVKLKWSIKNGLPGTVIVKAPKIDHINKIIDETGGPKLDDSFVVAVHQAECDAYSLIQTCPIPVPKVYACWPITDTNPGLVVMEDLGDHGGIVPYLSDGVTLEQWRNVVAALADLHAWSLTTDIPWKNKLSTMEDSLGKFFQGFEKTLAKALKDTKQKYPEYFGNLNEEAVLKELSFDASMKTYVDIRNETGEVLQHGDIWVNNIMFNKKSDGSLGDTVVAFLDWQICMRGAGVLDITHFESWCVNRDMRRSHYKEMLKFYYDRLKLKSGDKITITYEELEKGYEKAWVIEGFLCATMVESMVGTIAKCGDDENRTREMLERLQGVYEDAIKFSGWSND